MTQAKTSEEIGNKLNSIMSNEERIEYEKKKWYPAEQSILMEDKENLRNSLTSEILKSVKKMIDEIKTCESIVGLHICGKHPEDCYFMVDVDELKQKLKSISKSNAKGKI